MNVKFSLVPLVINYRGRTYGTKALKCSYSAHYVLYKVVLLSEISPISRCWLVCDRSRWIPVVGQCLPPSLLAAILGALRGFDNASGQLEEKKKRVRSVYA
jgi:hypothetical protein